MPTPDRAGLDVERAACPNCDCSFAACGLKQRPAFCPACGQETNIRPPPLREFIQQFGGAYFSTEGALWRSVKVLLTRPGELTAQYLVGRRKQYVLPLRLFLSVAVVMLLVMRVSSIVEFAPVEDPAVADALPSKPRSVSLELGLGRAGLEDGTFYCEGLPQWLCRRLKPRLDVDTRVLMARMSKVSDRVASNAVAALCALMPAFALGLSLLWRRRRMGYTEHLVFALHLHAFWCLVIAFMFTGFEPLVWAGLLVLPVYGLLAMHRVYGGRWSLLVLRAGLLFAAHAACVAVMVVTLALAALLL